MKSLLKSIEEKKSRWIHLKNIVNSANSTIDRIRNHDYHYRESKVDKKSAKIKSKEAALALKKSESAKSLSHKQSNES